MGEPKSIIPYHLGEYGRVKVKLAELLNSKGITRNHLAALTGVRYHIIDKYYSQSVSKEANASFRQAGAAARNRTAALSIENSLTDQGSISYY